MTHFRGGHKSGMIFGCQQRLSAAYWLMRTHSLVSELEPSPAAGLVTRRCGSSLSRGAQKNILWSVRDDASQLLRPNAAASAGFVGLTVSYSARYRGSSGSLPSVLSVWSGEARATGVPGRQSVLYQTLCVLRGATLPLGDDQGYCRGAAP